MKTLTTLGPVAVNNWFVQGSVFDNESICLIFVDANYGSTIVKFFTDEEDALAYMRYVTTTDTSAL